MLRGGAVRSAHRLHGPEDAGSNPAPASISDVETKKLSCPEGGKAASLRASITEKRMNDGKLGHLGLFLDPSAQPPKLHPPTQPQAAVSGMWKFQVVQGWYPLHSRGFCSAAALSRLWISLF